MCTVQKSTAPSKDFTTGNGARSRNTAARTSLKREEVGEVEIWHPGRGRRILILQRNFHIIGSQTLKSINRRQYKTTECRGRTESFLETLNIGDFPKPLKRKQHFLFLYLELYSVANPLIVVLHLGVLSTHPPSCCSRDSQNESLLGDIFLGLSLPLQANDEHERWGGLKLQIRSDSRKRNPLFVLFMVQWRNKMRNERNVSIAINKANSISCCKEPDERLCRRHGSHSLNLHPKPYFFCVVVKLTFAKSTTNCWTFIIPQIN